MCLPPVASLFHPRHLRMSLLVMPRLPALILMSANCNNSPTPTSPSSTPPPSPPLLLPGVPSSMHLLSVDSRSSPQPSLHPRSLHHPATSSLSSTSQLAVPTSVASIPPVSDLLSATQREAPALYKAACLMSPRRLAVTKD